MSLLPLPASFFKLLPLPQKFNRFHRFRFQLLLPLPQPWFEQSNTSDINKITQQIDWLLRNMRT